ncbi:MAG TPA: polysaccharide biosynthesis/export family protein, partial [Solimonas sp.]|nr:polysaccharide biosynthesis/export family protein [Solimonas sp.]
IGDLIRIDLLGDRPLTLQTRLDEKGTVTLAFLGEVRAVGLSVRQLESSIATGLRQGGYLTTPEVQVLVMEYRPFYVNGEVKRPGGYPYVPGLTAQKAVTLAGGLTPLASQNKVYVIREMNAAGTREKITLDSAIFPGDTVIVEEGLF